MFDKLFLVAVVNVLLFFVAMFSNNETLTKLWFVTYPIAFAWCVWFAVRKFNRN